MVKRLAGLGLMERSPYKSIALTAAGEAVALEIVRHHRLLELYLAEFLGMPWDEVHAEADRLEHHISEDLEERIAERLGQPLTDPHGDLIPRRDLTLPERRLVDLASLSAGAEAVVARINDQHAGLLQYLGTLGLVPGAHVSVVCLSDFGGVVTIKVGCGEGFTHTIARDVAAKVAVVPSGADVLVTP
jgi:DtxR family Mn-dependent transcriptional regulator